MSIETKRRCDKCERDIFGDNKTLEGWSKPMLHIDKMSFTGVTGMGYHPAITLTNRDFCSLYCFVEYIRQQHKMINKPSFEREIRINNEWFNQLQ